MKNLTLYLSQFSVYRIVPVHYVEEDKILFGDSIIFTEKFNKRVEEIVDRIYEKRRSSISSSNIGRWWQYFLSEKSITEFEEELKKFERKKARGDLVLRLRHKPSIVNSSDTLYILCLETTFPATSFHSYPFVHEDGSTFGYIEGNKIDLKGFRNISDKIGQFSQFSWDEY